MGLSVRDDRRSAKNRCLAPGRRAVPSHRSRRCPQVDRLRHDRPDSRRWTRHRLGVPRAQQSDLGPVLTPARYPHLASTFREARHGQRVARYTVEQHVQPGQRHLVTSRQPHRTRTHQPHRYRHTKGPTRVIMRSGARRRRGCAGLTPYRPPFGAASAAGVMGSSTTTRRPGAADARAAPCRAIGTVLGDPSMRHDRRARARSARGCRR